MILVDAGLFVTQTEAELVTLLNLKSALENPYKNVNVEVARVFLPNQKCFLEA